MHKLSRLYARFLISLIGGIAATLLQTAVTRWTSIEQQTQAGTVRSGNAAGQSVRVSADARAARRERARHRGDLALSIGV